MGNIFRHALKLRSRHSVRMIAMHGFRHSLPTRDQQAASVPGDDETITLTRNSP
jgi:hypothetical protein